MLNFKKDYKLRIISLVVAVVFFFTNTVYGIELPQRTLLRKHLDFDSSHKDSRYGAILKKVKDILSHPSHPSKRKKIGIKRKVLNEGQDISSLPGPERVRKCKYAFDYAGSLRDFNGVDLEHFVHAQNRLAERELSKDVLKEVLEVIGADTKLTGEKAYEAIYARLTKGVCSKKVIDTINEYDPKTGESTYEIQRMDIAIGDQNPNPRAQGVYEAVSNSLDADTVK